MRLLVIAVTLLFSLAIPARASVVDQAFDDAFAAFGRVLPQLSAQEFGVDVRAYRDALALGEFTSAHWGGRVRMEVVVREASEGSCASYAAFVRMPPENGVVALVICPQFVSGGTPELRALTILHELVHVVAGPDECRAMAFAARVEHLAHGHHTPVDRYWHANGCESSSFSLP